MKSAEPLLPSHLQLARDASSLGDHERLLTSARNGTTISLRRGVYISAETLQNCGPEERYRALALAVGRQRERAVFAGCTAAVLFGLPVVGSLPDEIFLMSRTTSGRRRNGVVEFAHTHAIDVVQHDGLAMTSLPDTLIDVARTMPHLMALVTLDAALHRDRSGTTPLVTMGELHECFTSRLPFPRSRRVAALFAFATEWADSPLESLSRWRVWELGFPEPELQRPVWVPSLGSRAYLDLAWPEFGVWGEADGVGKYLGASGSEGDRRSTAQIVLDEKRRENAVRAVTSWRCARWDWTEAWSHSSFRRILLDAGLPLVRR